MTSLLLVAVLLQIMAFIVINSDSLQEEQVIKFFSVAHENFDIIKKDQLLEAEEVGMRLAALDFDHSKSLNRTELYIYLEKAYLEFLPINNMIYNILDADSNGIVNANDVALIFESYDKGGEGFIDNQEYNNFVASRLKATSKK